MSDIGKLPFTPKGSSLERVVSAIGEVYGRIETDQGAFLVRAEEKGLPLRCPPGCGECCKPFVPDILPVEAAYAAAWILERKPELAAGITGWKSRPHGAPCPLLIKTEEGDRCSIYPARFLICRLFGVSGSRDKDGCAAFRPCVHMPIPGLRPAGGANPPMTSGELIELFGSRPPVMADYAAQIVGLAPSEGGERRSVYEALPLALVRAGLCLSLAEDSYGAAPSAAPSLAAAAGDGTYSNADDREKEASA